MASPVTIELKYNGIRIRFDGIEQRLRLVEIIEWGRMSISYKGVEMGYVNRQHLGLLLTGIIVRREC